MVWAPKFMHTAKALSLRLTRTVSQTIMISKFHHPLLRFMCLDQQAENHWKKHLFFFLVVAVLKSLLRVQCYSSARCSRAFTCGHNMWPPGFHGNFNVEKNGWESAPSSWAPGNGLFHKYFRWIVKREKGFGQWFSNHSTLKNNLKNLFKDMPFWGPSPGSFAWENPKSSVFNRNPRWS